MGGVHFNTYFLALSSPSLDGFHQALSALVTKVLSERETLAAKIVEARVKADSRFRDLMNECAGRTDRILIGLSESGDRPRSRQALEAAFCKAWITVPYLPEGRHSEFERRNASQSVVAALDALFVNIRTAREEILGRAYAELESQRVTKIDAEDIERARIRSEHAALFERLPSITRENAAAGNADQSAIELALRRLIRIDAGYLPTPFQVLGSTASWEHSEPIKDRSDDEYRQLVAARTAAPIDAVVEASTIWNGNQRGLREATEKERLRGRHVDGKIWKRGKDEHRVLLVTWSRGGLKTHVAIPFANPD